MLYHWLLVCQEWTRVKHFYFLTQFYHNSINDNLNTYIEIQKFGNLFTDLDVDRAINAMHFVSDMEEEGIFQDRNLPSTVIGTAKNAFIICLITKIISPNQTIKSVLDIFDRFEVHPRAASKWPTSEISTMRYSGRCPLLC